MENDKCNKKIQAKSSRSHEFQLSSVLIG